MTRYFCCDERRRDAVIASQAFNGIDYVEVVDSDATVPADRQRILLVHFLKTPAPAGIVPANVVIEGGDRIRGLAADGVTYQGDVVSVHLTAYGDYSTYRLRLIKADASTFDPSKLDPLLASVAFSFKVECPNDFDCATSCTCAPPIPAAPEIDYLAKDYLSYRQLMLDRMSVVAPQWTERNAADVGVTLVELLAYVADQLSYRQDAVATEAYLFTARRRVSVRRHARLVDYFMHDGKSARAFVHFEVGADITLPKGATLYTALPGETVLLPADFTLSAADAPLAEAFETLHAAPLAQAHNSIAFYTWGNGRCVLPVGATSATLTGHFPALAAGMVLIFEEVIGPQTGLPEDADPSHRAALRLTSVTASSDPLGGAFAQPPNQNAVDVTEIEWSADDALAFPLTLSTRVTDAQGEHDVPGVSVARGNIVLADHGATVASEDLGAVPEPFIMLPPPPTADPCANAQPTPLPPRFRPRLKSGPLACANPYDNANPPASASATLLPPLAEAMPRIELTGTAGGSPPLAWAAQRDLLNSDPNSPDFVVETEADGSVFLRFGDGTHGQRPTPGTEFAATYRVGGGRRGNVGIEAISHAVGVDPAVRIVRNPLAAQGGIDPESIADVRHKAPFAFRTQMRAVTPEDYQAVAQGYPQVQRAAATFRWTGSWWTVQLSIDRLGGQPVDAAFADQIRAHVEPFRTAGHDLDVEGPNYVPLEIDARVAVASDHFRSDVEAALEQLFSSRVLPDGSRGIFHSDNFTFGQPVYLSPLYAAAKKVDGVSSITISKFQRLGRDSTGALQAGRLDVERLEIARLDNDPNFPDRGVFRLSLEGGK
jgi:Baseplate J-like protein